MIRVILPAHLRTLARLDGDLELDVGTPVTLGAVLETLEKCCPVLRGTVRDHITLQRRPLVRFFACGQDFSHEQPDFVLPEEVVTGVEPFIILGAIAGG